MNLKEVSEEIRELLEKKRVENCLNFIEEDHIYFMKDIDGQIKSDFLSVSSIIKKFHKKFDANGISLKMSGGDVEKQQKLLEEWRYAGDYSKNMGSRVHYELEKELICRYGDYKNVREPIYSIDEEQRTKSDNMVEAGKKFIDLIHERGGVLLDTEIVLGDPQERYVGQPDKVWLFYNKEKTDFGFVITDYKSNKPKNFEVHSYTGKLYPPFQDYPDNALGHYYLQIPLYGRLLLKMLKGTKYEDKKLMGGLIVLLKEDGNFDEYRVPAFINKTVLTMDLSNYTRK